MAQSIFLPHVFELKIDHDEMNLVNFRNEIYFTSHPMEEIRAAALVGGDFSDHPDAEQFEEDTLMCFLASYEGCEDGNVTEKFKEFAEHCEFVTDIQYWGFDTLCNLFWHCVHRSRPDIEYQKVERKELHYNTYCYM